jgi:hypothetical protein
VGDATTHEPTEYAIGKFSSSLPNDQDICTAPTLSENTFSNPMMMADLSYKWSNFKIIVRATSNAYHFGADLVRKDGACTVNYTVSASAPVVYCGDGMKPKLDDNGMPTGEMEPDPTTGKPVPEACDTDPVHGSLSPDLVWKCDATDDGKGSHLCVPANEFPSLAGKK